MANSNDETGFWQRFWDFICDYEQLFLLAFGINSAMFLMLLVSAFGIRRGTPTFVIWVMSVVILVPTIIWTGATYYKCVHHEREDRW